MSRIAVIITNLFEDSEYTEPAEAFRSAGHELVHVGLNAGETVHGKKENTPVTIDEAVSDVSANDFDALLIPGGYSPDQLRVDWTPWVLPGNLFAAASRCLPSATHRSC